MTETIKDILMRRDGVTAEYADHLIQAAKEELRFRLDTGDEASYDICEEYFGLEPDYLDELLDMGI